VVVVVRLGVIALKHSVQIALVEAIPSILQFAILSLRHLFKVRLAISDCFVLLNHVKNMVRGFECFIKIKQGKKRLF